MQNTVTHLAIHYNTDIYKLIEEYRMGKSIKGISDAIGIGFMPVRTICSVLNLRFKLKHRENDLKILETRLNSGGDNPELIERLTRDLEVIQGELYKNTKTIQSLRDSNSVLRRNVREQARDEYSFNTLLEELRVQFDNLELSKMDFSDYKSSNNDGTTVLVLSDTHYNELINEYSSNGQNIYNNNNCKARIRKTVYEMITSNNATEELHVYLLGDLISGIIHLGELTGEEPTTKAIVDFAEFLGSVLQGLSKTYKSMKVFMVNGNHSRISDIGKINAKGYDFEFMLFHMLKLQLPDVNMQYSTNGYLVDIIHGHPIGMFHGDLVRSYDGNTGISSYKIQNIIEGLFGVRVNTLVSGHTHKACTIANSFGGYNIVNASTSGAFGDYGISGGFDNVSPSQCFFRVGTDGIIKEVHHVDLRGINE